MTQSQCVVVGCSGRRERTSACYRQRNRGPQLVLGAITLLAYLPQVWGAQIKYCSGVSFLSTNEGLITDGAVDTGMGVYKENTDCKWVIKPAINDQREKIKRRVVLHFEYLNVEAGFDFVKVHETNEAGKLLGKFTGSTLPPSVVASVGILYIQFKTDGSGQRLGFKARFDTFGCPSECGNRGSCVWEYCYCDEGYFGGDCSSSSCVGTKRYTSIVGNMMDHYRTMDESDVLVIGTNLTDGKPFYQKDVVAGEESALPSNFMYKNNLDCRWLLKPLKLFAPYFTLEFLLMDSELGRDMLYVYDGPNMNAPKLAQVSGQNVSMPLLTSASNALFLRFETDKLKANFGFFAFWDTMKECGGVIGFCNDGGQKVDGSFRPKRGFCLDTVNKPPLHIRKGRCTCFFGWFGGDCSFKWCLGAKTLRDRIGYFTDHHDEYKPIDAYGSVTPYSTKDYRASSYCRWYITPQADANFIVVKFIYFEMERGTDFLTVYDGGGYSAGKIFRNYNHTSNIDGILTDDGLARVPQQVMLGRHTASRRPKLFFHFQSDASNIKLKRGFHARYEALYCYGRQTVTGRTGNITDGSPPDKFYYPRTECYWQIKPDESYFQGISATLDIIITRLDVRKDKLTIYDGPSDKYPILASFTCGANTPCPTVPIRLTATGREVTVKWFATCHSTNNCRDCNAKCLKKSGEKEECCNRCFACNYGKAQLGTGLQLYRNEKNAQGVKYGESDDIFEHEFFKENCQCDQLGRGWSLDYEVRPVSEFCDSKNPIKFTHWWGEFTDHRFANTYHNNADCKWLIDVDPATSRSPTSYGGFKVEKLDIFLEQLDIDNGKNKNDLEHIPLDENKVTKDFLTIYKGPHATDEHCNATCILECYSRICSYNWKGCQASITNNPSSPSCMLTKQTGTMLVCNRADPFTKCWDSPNHWTVAFSQVLVRFQSSPWYVGNGFKIRWEAEISNANKSIVYGLGSTRAIAGVAADVGVQTVWQTSLGFIQNRSTGGATVQIRFVYTGYPANETVFQTARDTNDGRYHMYYVPKFAGVHRLFVTLFGENVAGSPYTVVVKSGDIDAQKCWAWDTVKLDKSTDGLKSGRAGKDHYFMISCRDEYGNLIKEGSKWKNPFMVKFQNWNLFWGAVEDQKNGNFKVTYNIPLEGEYHTHIHYKSSETTYVAIGGSPYKTVIRKVPCPIVGEIPCTARGSCADTGLCDCDAGFDGEYCQNDLSQVLRILIVAQNAILAVLLGMGLFKVFWDRWVIDKQMFDRLKHDDAEEDW